MGIELNIQIVKCLCAAPMCIHIHTRIRARMCACPCQWVCTCGISYAMHLSLMCLWLCFWLFDGIYNNVYRCMCRSEAEFKRRSRATEEKAGVTHNTRQNTPAHHRTSHHERSTKHKRKKKRNRKTNSEAKKVQPHTRPKLQARTWRWQRSYLYFRLVL